MIVFCSPNRDGQHYVCLKTKDWKCIVFGSEFLFNRMRYTYVCISFKVPKGTPTSHLRSEFCLVWNFMLVIWRIFPLVKNCICQDKAIFLFKWLFFGTFWSIGWNYRSFCTVLSLDQMIFVNFDYLNLGETAN